MLGYTYTCHRVLGWACTHSATKKAFEESQTVRRVPGAWRGRGGEVPAEAAADLKGGEVLGFGV